MDDWRACIISTFVDDTWESPKWDARMCAEQSESFSGDSFAAKSATQENRNESVRSTCFRDMRRDAHVDMYVLYVCLYRRKKQWYRAIEFECVCVIERKKKRGQKGVDGERLLRENHEALIPLSSPPPPKNFGEVAALAFTTCTKPLHHLRDLPTPFAHLFPFISTSSAEFTLAARREENRGKSREETMSEPRRES